MKDLYTVLFRPYYPKYQRLHYRILSLETALDCLLNSPQWTPSDEIGFNGQKQRKTVFRDLLRTFSFEAVVETGTQIGNTTGYLATTSQLPVFSCELNRLYHSIARQRLQGIPGVTLHLADSRSFLRLLAGQDVAEKRVFVYLDAHWYDDLPLRSELEILCRSWKELIIMVDDFQVPGDSGYGYDHYGWNKRLSLRVFARTFSQHGLVPFFPAAPSGQETGDRRGCVVLARKGASSEKLASLPSLRTGSR